MQADQVPRVGMLIGYAENDPETQARLSAFRQGRDGAPASRAMPVAEVLEGGRNISPIADHAGATGGSLLLAPKLIARCRPQNGASPAMVIRCMRRRLPG
jgi:hypothetical protein